jgi:hypothetical protein
VLAAAEAAILLRIKKGLQNMQPFVLYDNICRSSLAL